MKKNEVARNVRVKFNDSWKPKSMSDEHLQREPIIFISSEIYNDVIGDYVFIRGGSFVNSGNAYLTELDLEFPVGETPLYSIETIYPEI